MVILDKSPGDDGILLIESGLKVYGRNEIGDGEDLSCVLCEAVGAWGLGWRNPAVRPDSRAVEGSGCLREWCRKFDPDCS